MADFPWLLPDGPLHLITRAEVEASMVEEAARIREELARRRNLFYLTTEDAKLLADVLMVAADGRLAFHDARAHALLYRLREHADRTDGETDD